jgi:tRNA(Ile)-lysidine synthase
MVHQLIERVRRYSDTHQLLAQESHIIVGLSGGPDSMALLSLLHALAPHYSYTLSAAHLDHQWRATSHKDVLFCQKFAESLSIPFMHTTADKITLTRKTYSPEDKGRYLRRTYFEELSRANNNAAIALGHHSQDQQETFFIRLVRGTSIAGLASMKPKHAGYIRPLLDCSKQELLGYLKDTSIPYLHDETNDDPRYLRNAVRSSVLPALRACDARFDLSFYKALADLQETDAYLERVAELTLVQITSEDSLHIEEFLATDKFLHPRLLVAWLRRVGIPFIPTTSFFDELVRFMKNNAIEHQMHPHWKMIKSGNLLTIYLVR